MEKVKIPSLSKLPLGAIIAKGWLGKQLEVQKKGLSGNLPKLWSEVSDKSAWLGGDGEAWERGPYYLNGLIPLAWTLKDDQLKAECQKWVEAILSSAREDGMFGPTRSEDWWARVEALCALQSYHEATNDPRILPFFKNFFAYQLKMTEKHPPYLWFASRAEEEFEVIWYYYQKTGDKEVLPLVDLLKKDSYPWFDIFEKLPYTKPSEKYLSKTIINLGRKLGGPSDDKKKHGTKPLKELNAKQVEFRNKAMKTHQLTHGVNWAMALKYPAYHNLFYPFENFGELAKKGYRQVMKHHGYAIGAFSSDEQLHGNDPTKGIELCAVAELAYSMEKLIQFTGDGFFADVLELLIYNAFPATVTDDFTAHQYVQQPNQIGATIAHRAFFDVDSDGNTFGLEPNFGCCTANMHQVFPRFVENSCFKTPDGFAFFNYAPSLIYTEVEGKRIRFNMNTAYPFEDEAILSIEDLDIPKKITLYFKAPYNTTISLFYKGRKVAESDDFVSFTQTFTRDDFLTVKFNTKLSVENNPDGSVSIRRGNLIFVPEIALAERKIKGTEPFHDREYRTDRRWRDIPVFIGDKPAIMSTTRNKVDRTLPFGRRNAPIKIICESVIIENWKEKHGNACDYPSKPKLAKENSVVTLIPYGFSKLRISQFPKIQRPARAFISNETLSMMDEEDQG